MAVPRPVSVEGSWTFAPSLAGALQRIAAGDESALAEFYRHTAARTFGLACKILRDRAAAEEVMLDVYTQVWLRAGTWSPQRGEPLVWLLMLARSRAIDHLRATGALPSRDAIAALGTELGTEEVSPEPGPAESSARAEHCARVRAALAALPRGQREAIAASFYGGLSHSEIAAELQVPLGTVKTRIRSAMTALRGALGAIQEEL